MSELRGRARLLHCVGLACLLLVVAPACKKRTIVPAPPPAPPPAASVDPEPEPVVSLFEEAEQAYVAGNYASAADRYARLLDSGEGSDLILWRLAMLETLADEEERDLEKARSYLEQLQTGYPDSPYQSEAVLLGLLLEEMQKLAAVQNRQSQQIRRLSDELEKLKKIDLNRRKPPPAPLR